MLHLKTIKSIFLLIFLGFIWGSGYTLAKFAMTNGVNPLGYAFWQSLGPALLLTLVSLLKKQTLLLHPVYWPYFFICGLIGIAIPNTNMYFIASHIPAGLLAVLVNTVPLLVYPLALLSGQEKLDKWRFFALLLGMSGILAIIGISFSGIYSSWTILAMLSPLGFAFCSIYIGARQPKEINALQAANGMLLAASLLLAPVVLKQHAFYSLSAPFTFVKQIVILEIILSSLGYLLFFILIRMAGPVFYSLTGGVVAITGLFWGYLAFDEKPSSIQSMAIALVVSAIFLLSWRQSRQTQGV
ncbi:DMT family transporter [Legionella pneumophila]|uniref:ABC transporter, transmembrane permease,permeases of drug/metabolite transporter type n=1 Tax=Legionella pneumophila subsp. pascullei TaxID=91890 RepID=A0AAX2IW80_LEGPN|nr:DMT family transporter [Legionella pneumophila]AMP89508.1 multidrug ABC transporter permease [Legionella pneumophila subsp. pascullei]AMP92826.1 multidrug ABC transporter permease [Legionella pneumophila subsp. pascullei]AMP95792.1 multidrug ABC transporter permease [Legionella pneumophila subsp. pascullei]SQG90707.1 ABC transporter, transmembrane permease,permeases of drug/metabolite transporter type [Legionella pneumophila subsp. pascullei]VEH07252.1 ABC transporter, transmembrane permeas